MLLSFFYLYGKTWSFAHRKHAHILLSISLVLYSSSFYPQRFTCFTLYKTPSFSYQATLTSFHFSSLTSTKTKSQLLCEVIFFFASIYYYHCTSRIHFLLYFPAASMIRRHQSVQVYPFFHCKKDAFFRWNDSSFILFVCLFEVLVLGSGFLFLQFYGELNFENIVFEHAINCWFFFFAWNLQFAASKILW